MRRLWLFCGMFLLVFLAGGFHSARVDAQFNSADLSVTLSGPATVTRGTSVTYTAFIHNHGPSTAQTVSVNTISSGDLRFTPAGSSSGCSGDIVIDCPLGNLSPGQSRTITMRFDVQNTPYCSTRTDQLRTTPRSNTADPNHANNAPTQNVTILCSPFSSSSSSFYYSSSSSYAYSSYGSGFGGGLDDLDHPIFINLGPGRRYDTNDPQCRDGFDNDNDGARDFPADFSCSSPDDNDETYPQPQCNDNIDNDNDILDDFPLDRGCTSRQDNDELPQAQYSSYGSRTRRYNSDYGSGSSIGGSSTSFGTSSSSSSRSYWFDTEGGSSSGGLKDTDGDGIPDIYDDDDDNDGIPDNEDPDANGNGIPDDQEKDTDGDGIPDYLDSDDDNDGIPDYLDPDDDNDGIPDYFDPDHPDYGSVGLTGSRDGNRIFGFGSTAFSSLFDRRFHGKLFGDLNDIQIGIEQDRADALPGSEVTYRVFLRNGRSTSTGPFTILGTFDPKQVEISDAEGATIHDAGLLRWKWNSLQPGETLEIFYRIRIAPTLRHGDRVGHSACVYGFGFVQCGHAAGITVLQWLPATGVDLP